MTRIGSVFAPYLPSTEKYEATEGEVWFWIAVTVSFVPWVAGAWLIW